MYINGNRYRSSMAFRTVLTCGDVSAGTIMSLSECDVLLGFLYIVGKHAQILTVGHGLSQ